MKRSELVQSVINWNRRFPLDRWWRMKHNVAFMSPVHRESSFIHQLLEFEEDKLFLQDNSSDKEEYVPNIGEFLKTTPTLESFASEAQEEIKKMLKQEEQNG